MSPRLLQLFVCGFRDILEGYTAYHDFQDQGWDHGERIVLVPLWLQRQEEMAVLLGRTLE
jgi:hypothetical protein